MNSDSSQTNLTSKTLKINVHGGRGTHFWRPYLQNPLEQRSKILCVFLFRTEVFLKLKLGKSDWRFLRYGPWNWVPRPPWTLIFRVFEVKFFCDESEFKAENCSLGLFWPRLLESAIRIDIALFIHNIIGLWIMLLLMGENQKSIFWASLWTQDHWQILNNERILLFEDRCVCMRKIDYVQVIKLEIWALEKGFSSKVEFFADFRVAGSSCRQLPMVMKLFLLDFTYIGSTWSKFQLVFLFPSLSNNFIKCDFFAKTPLRPLFFYYKKGQI